MVDADSFFDSSDLGGLAHLLLGKMLQDKGLLYDEKNGAF